MRFARNVVSPALASTAFMALAMASPATAQDQSPPDDLAGDIAQENEDDGVIVVTARRREERLIDVPVSVTAISGEQLEKSGTLELTEVAQKVPNVTLEVSRGTNTTLTAFIRGIGQQDPVAGFEAGVGLYVDDVYINRPQAAVLDVYDVERIEVLRGPQGTLYGRNTIGGAVKYVSRRLPDEMELKIRGTYGSYDQADLVISGAVPLTDELRFGASAARLSRGGFGDNLNQPGVENYNKDVYAGRASLEYHGDSIFLRLSGDYVRDESDPRQGHRLIPGQISGAPVLDDVFDTRAGLTVPDSVVEAYGGALKAEIDLSDSLMLRSITAYREDKSASAIDFDSLPAADLDVPVIYENSQFSQELQLVYESGNLNGLVGAYYLDANAFNVFDVLLGTTGAVIGLPGLNAQTFGDVDTKTWSIFGDFTYDFSDHLSVSAGGRYTSDKRSSRILRRTFIGGFSDSFGGSGTAIATTSDFTGSETFKEFTPRASISWKPTEDHNIYFSYSRGFKGGGFDPRGQSSATPDFDQNGSISADEIFEFLSFDPETVDSYELGWKASLLDNRLNISIAAFKQDYTDVQIPGSVGIDTNGDGISDSFAGITSNAASADVNGFEFEGSALVGRDFFGMPGSRFNVTWAFGYLDAKYNTFIDALGNDVADSRVFQNTPTYTVNATTDWGIPVANGMLDLITSLSLRSDASQFETPNPFLDQDGFALVDMSLVYTDDADRFSIGLHGKNIFDKEYIVSGYNFVALGPNGQVTPTLGLEGTLTAFYGNPRQVFVTGQIKF